MLIELEAEIQTEVCVCVCVWVHVCVCERMCAEMRMLEVGGLGKMKKASLKQAGLCLWKEFKNIYHQRSTQSEYERGRQHWDKLIF